MTKKSLLAILAMFSLSACTIDVNTARALGSDEEVRPLDIPALDQNMAEQSFRARIEPLAMRHPDGTTAYGVHLIVPDSKAVIVYLGRIG